MYTTDKLLVKYCNFVSCYKRNAARLEPNNFIE